MKLVIDIPEGLVCDGFERTFTEEEKNILIKAIGNGTPLPKGHGRLIDADAIKAEIEKQEKWLWQAGYTAYNVDIALNAIKAVIEESVDAE